MLEAGGRYGAGKLINETDGTDGFAAEEFTVDAAGLVIRYHMLKVLLQEVLIYLKVLRLHKSYK